MKRMKLIFQKLLLLAVCSFFLINSSIAQEKFNLRIGANLPEMLTIGAKYQINQIQLGVYFGGDPFGSDDLLTLSGDISYHFIGYSKFTERKSWFMKTGFTGLRNEVSSYIKREVYLNVRAGRDINISKKFGFDIDFGFSAVLYHQKEEKGTHDPELETSTDTPLYYSLGAGFFYRL